MWKDSETFRQLEARAVQVALARKDLGQVGLPLLLSNLSIGYPSPTTAINKMPTQLLPLIETSYEKGQGGRV